jgi:thioredoxin reductase (NADPH)
MNTKHSTVCIIGSGPAGYTAGVYLARANITATLITGLEQGGQLMTTTGVENWPGGSETLQGPELMQQMQAQVEHYNVPIVQDSIQSCDLSKTPFILKGESMDYTCDALIIATGARARYLGLAAETKYQGKGVSACATCDGFFYKDKPVLVVGGGNTAVEEAIYLSKIVKTVTLVHRRDQLRADKILAERLFQQKNIHMEWDTVLEDILGNDQGVTGVKLKNVKTNAVKTIDVDGVFIAIGHTPNTEIFKEQIKLTQGYIYIQGTSNSPATATNIPGVFGAGDVVDPYYKQAVTAAAWGCMAAIDTEKYLASLKKT